jgi:hypothetical protein
MTGEITFQQMQLIVAAGGGLILDATTLTSQIMQMLASAAGTSGASLTFFQVGHLSAQELQLIAQAGKGHVVFDLTR